MLKGKRGVDQEKYGKHHPPKNHWRSSTTRRNKSCRDAPDDEEDYTSQTMTLRQDSWTFKLKAYSHFSSMSAFAFSKIKKAIARKRKQRMGSVLYSASTSISPQTQCFFHLEQELSIYYLYTVTVATDTMLKFTQCWSLTQTHWIQENQKKKLPNSRNLYFL